jgi:tetraacyldisaccharide 4'-kinase
MTDTTSIQGFLGRRERTFTERLVAWLLLPFSLCYWFLIEYRRLFYHIGLFKSEKLPLPVISVGGLTMGGSGKTPVVIYLADFLASEGKRVLILTRGYGGETKAITVVRPGESAPMERLSDEVRLMADRLTATIAVGGDRVSAFHEASGLSTYDVVILDDGFQHLKIKRDVDIVAVDATAPYGSGYLFPAGNLREMKSSLKRADAVILTRTSQSREATAVLSGIRAKHTDMPVITSEYVFEKLEDIRSLSTVELDSLNGNRVFAFSAIAKPESFFLMLEKQGLDVTDRRGFLDHHIFTQIDIDEMIEQARAKRCSAFLVTEKDAVKLHSLNFEEIGVFSYRIRLQITKDEDTLHSLIRGIFDGNS